jgi:hypothetical protein
VLNLIRRSFAALYLVAGLTALSALLTLPRSAAGQAGNTCKIECERCTCNMNTGICDCTKCVLIGCRF